MRYIYICISKIVTFINMVITGVKNGSLDMILTPFDGKINEKTNELPPEAHRPLKTLKKTMGKSGSSKSF